MSRYVIPNYKLTTLARKITRIRNKGANVTFDIIDPEYIVNAIVNRHNVQIRCSEIEVEGTYIINGWVFVGIIQHASPENIIRLADNRFQGRIPERYRTAGRECEHCHMRRDRNDTYLIYNEDEDEFKQVGKTCLQSYTGGLNAETCAELADVIHELHRLNAQVDDGDFSDLDDIDNPSNYMYIDMTEVKKKAYKYVQEHGYESGETGRRFLNAFYEGELHDEASDQDLNNVQEYLENNRNNDYIRNALAVWTKNHFEDRDAGLVTSAVYSYLRFKQQEEQRRLQSQNINQTQAGNIGDKVTFTIADFRVAYMRTTQVSYRPMSQYPVYRILGNDGRIYIWACTTDVDLQNGMTLTGTVKRISEFRGETQTEVTRCKIISTPHTYRGFFSN